MILTIKCDWCNQEFKRNKSHVKNKNYCSRACLGKANAERFRLKRIKICDNCGIEFEGNNRHKNRNKHFFCSQECSNSFKEQKIYIPCDWCGKYLYKKRSDVIRNKHNFCDWGCYIDFINFANAGATNQIVAGTVLYRKLSEIKIGRKLESNEEVHHIDDNHLNNNIDNLQILTASEHSKIHAKQKARDAYGRFIKEKPNA